MEKLPKDISNREELCEFLQEFYQQARTDQIIGNKFDGMDLDSHIEVIADFWSSIIFGSNTYHGDPFGKHIPLALKKADFDRWLELFEQVLDSRFSGKNADEMKHRAKSIATIFQYKLFNQ